MSTTKTLSVKRTKIAQDVATSHFMDFYTHPEYRGPKFSWTAGFSQRESHWVDVQFAGQRWSMSQKVLAAQVAIAKWNDLVKENGLD